MSASLRPTSTTVKRQTKRFTTPTTHLSRAEKSQEMRQNEIQPVKYSIQGSANETYSAECWSAELCGTLCVRNDRLR